MIGRENDDAVSGSPCGRAGGSADAPGGALAFDDAMYPNLKASGSASACPPAGGQPSFDPTSCWGTTQTAPMTPEYKAMFEANLVDQAAGGQGTNATSTCLAPGMPMVHERALADGNHRRCRTPPTSASITSATRAGASTRTGANGPRRSAPASMAIPSATGSIPMAMAATTCWRSRPAASRVRAPTTPAACRCTGTIKSVIKERIYLDKANPNLLHDDITVIDNGLTRPGR